MYSNHDFQQKNFKKINNLYSNLNQPRYYSTHRNYLNKSNYMNSKPFDLELEENYNQNISNKQAYGPTNSSANNINIKMKINNINIKSPDNNPTKSISKFENKNELDPQYSNNFHKKNSSTISLNVDENIGGVIQKIKCEQTEISKYMKNSEEKMDKIKGYNSKFIGTNFYSIKETTEKKVNFEDQILNISPRREIDTKLTSNEILADLKNKNKSLEKELKNIRGKFLDIKLNHNLNKLLTESSEEFNNYYNIDRDRYLKPKDSELDTKIRTIDNEYLNEKHVIQQLYKSKEEEIESFYKNKLIKQDAIISDLNEINKSNQKAMLSLKKNLSKYFPGDLNEENFQVIKTYINLYDNSKWCLLINKKQMKSFWILEDDLMNAGFNLNKDIPALDVIEQIYLEAKQESEKFQTELTDLKKYFVNQINTKDNQLIEAKNEQEKHNSKSGALLESVNKLNNLMKQLKLENKDLRSELEEKALLLLTCESKFIDINEKLEFYIEEYNKIKLLNEKLKSENNSDPELNKLLSKIQKLENSYKISLESTEKYSKEKFKAEEMLNNKIKEIENLNRNFEEITNSLQADLVKKENTLKEITQSNESLISLNQENKELLAKITKEVNKYKEDNEKMKEGIENIKEQLDNEKNKNRTLKSEIINLKKQLEIIPNILNEDINNQTNLSKSIKESGSSKSVNMKTKLEQTTKEKASLETKLSSLIEEKNVLNTKIMDLLKDLISYDNKYKELEQKVEDLEGNEKQYLLKLELFDKQVKKLNESLIEEKENNSELLKHKNILENVVKDMKGQLKVQKTLKEANISNKLNKGNNIENYTITSSEVNLISNLRRSSSQIKVGNQEDKEEISALTNKINNLTEIIAKKDQKDNNYSKKIKQLMEERDKLNMHNKVLIDQNEKLVNQNENLSNSMNSQEEKLNNHLQEIQKLKQTQEELIKNFSLLEKEKEMYSNKLRQEETLKIEELTNMNITKDNLINELISDRDKAKVLEKEMNSKIEEYVDQISQHETKFIEYDNKIELLNKELEIVKKKEKVEKIDEAVKKNKRKTEILQDKEKKEVTNLVSVKDEIMKMEELNRLSTKGYKPNQFSKSSNLNTKSKDNADIYNSEEITKENQNMKEELVLAKIEIQKKSEIELTLKNEIDKLSKDLDAFKKDKEIDQSKINQLITDIKNIKNQDTSEENLQLNEKNERLINELNHKNKLKEKDELRIQNLTVELENSRNQINNIHQELSQENLKIKIQLENLSKDYELLKLEKGKNEKKINELTSDLINSYQDNRKNQDFVKLKDDFDRISKSFEALKLDKGKDELKISELTSDLINLNNKHNNKNQDLVKLKDEFERISKSYEALKLEKGKDELKISELISELANSKNVDNRKNQDLVKLKDDFERISKSFEALKSEKGKDELKISELISELANSKNVDNNKNQDLNKLKNEFELISKSFEALKSDKVRDELKISELTSELLNSNNKYQDKIKDVLKLQGEYDSLSKSFEAMKLEKGKDELKISELTSILTNSKNVDNSKNQDLVKLNDEFDKLTKDFNSLKLEKGKDEIKINQLTSDLNNSKNRASTKNQELIKSKDEFDKLSKAFQVLKLDKGKDELKINQLSSELMNLKNQGINQNQEDIIKLKGELEQLLKEFEALKVEKVKDELKINQLVSELAFTTKNQDRNQNQDFLLLKEEYEKVSKELEALKIENAKDELKINKPSELASSNNQDVSEKNFDIPDSKFKEEFSRMKKDLIDKTKEVFELKDKLEKSVGISTVKYKNLNTKLKERETQITEYTAKISNLEKKLEDLKKSSNSNEGQRSQLLEKETKIKELDDLLKLKDQEILQNHILNQDTEIQMEKFNEANIKLSEENQNLKNEINSLKNQISDLNGEILKLRTKTYSREPSRTYSNQLRLASNDNINTSSLGMNEDVQMKLVELEIIKEELNKKEGELLKYKEDFIYLQLKFNDLSEMLKQKDKEMSDFKIMNRELNEKINNIKGNSIIAYNNQLVKDNSIQLNINKSADISTNTNKILYTNPDKEEAEEELQNYKFQVANLKELILERDEELQKLTKENEQYKLEIEKNLKFNEPDNVSFISKGMASEVSSILLQDDDSHVKEKLEKYKQIINNFKQDNKTLLNQLGILKAEIKNLQEKNAALINFDGRIDNYEEYKSLLLKLLDNYKPKNKEYEDIANKIKGHLRRTSENTNQNIITQNTSQTSDKSADKQKGFFGTLFSSKKKK